MTFQFTLQKILSYKEKVKLEAEGQLSEAAKLFEEEATKLFHLLKQKEMFEESCQELIQQKISILQIQQNEAIIERLQHTITKQQHVTNSARENMYRKQEHCISLSMELKKYEKMKEIQQEEYNEFLKREDNKQMDEIAVQKFMNR